MIRTLLALAFVYSATHLVAAENLLRNGSFEGSAQYWVTKGVSTQGDAAHGGWFLHCADKTDIRSGSISLAPGQTVQIAVSGRSDQQSHIQIYLCPSNREVAQAAKLVWNGKAGYRHDCTPTWTRSTWSFTVPNVDDKGAFPGSDNTWWNKRSWVVFASVDGQADVDALSVSVSPSETYPPHGEVEVVADAPDLPGYAATANLLTTDTFTVRASVHNAGPQREITLRWECLDPLGETRFGDAHEQVMIVAKESTVQVRYDLPLAGRGLMLGRVSVIGSNGSVLSSSDQPLTRLAFPKHATVVDANERFGASLRGGPLYDAAQAIGLRWTRWHPSLNWEEIQKDGPETWAFNDALVDKLAGKGIAVNAVLYALPDWAKGSHKNLPRDMEDWQADDSRWNDLSVVTVWDTFVRTTVKHFAGRVVTWEFANEPDLSGHWDSAIYAVFAKRTYRLVKEANPQANVLVNVTWPGVSGWTRDFLSRGGSQAFDVHSFHNYTAGELSDQDGVKSLLKTFASYGEKRRVWFNEGWTYVPTSLDDPALPIVDVSPVECANRIVRSAAGLTAAGLEKMICFHIGYAQHGKSYWDWVGSGTEWWDDYGNPTIAVATWNTLCHHLGLSQVIATVDGEGFTAHVFQDLRNKRGVAVLWSAGKAVDIAIGPHRTWDIVGNERQQAGALTLAADRRPVFVAIDGADGSSLNAALAPFRKVRPRDQVGAQYIPSDYVGTTIGGTAGNPVLSNGQPVWRFDRVWPDDPTQAANYRSLSWNGTNWIDPKDSHGGQPAIDVKGDRVLLTGRTAWGGEQNRGKLPALVFVPPQIGTWTLSARVAIDTWSGRPDVYVDAFAIEPSHGTVRELGRATFSENRVAKPWSLTVEIAKGEEVALVPRYQNGHTAATVTLSDLVAIPAPATRRE